MTQSTDDFKKTLDKWTPFLNSMSDNEDNWLLQYASKHKSNEDLLNESIQNEFPTLLPIAMKISARTIGMDLVSVQPMKGPGGTSKDEMDRIQAEIKADNRDSKIDSVIEDKEYVEKTVEDHPDYKGPSNIGLLYIDYSYSPTASVVDNSTLGKLGR